jgi:DNA-binding MarR family transcriptional regulator
MTRSRNQVTQTAASVGLVEDGAGGPVSAGDPSRIELEAAEVWKIMSDMVLDNARRRKVADSLGLSFGRARALRRIVAGPKPMRELADALGIDAPYLTLVVDDLERQGLVERRPHPTDRRVKLVVATRRGKDAARRAETILGTPPEGLAALDQQDLTELVRILRQVAGPVER